jgi:LysR substrate binding domain
MFPAAAVGSKWFRRRKIELTDLQEARWSIPPDASFVRPLIDEAFRAKGLDAPLHTVGSNSVQLSTALLATGRFVGVLSDSTLRLSGKRHWDQTLAGRFARRPPQDRNCDSQTGLLVRRFRRSSYARATSPGRSQSLRLSQRSCESNAIAFVGDFNRRRREGHASAIFASTRCTRAGSR